MPLLLYDEEGRVYLEHYQPNELPEEERKKGLWVDELPARPEVGRGEDTFLKVKGKNVVWEKRTRDLKEYRPDEKMNLILEKMNLILEKLAKKE